MQPTNHVPVFLEGPNLHASWHGQIQWQCLNDYITICDDPGGFVDGSRAAGIVFFPSDGKHSAGWNIRVRQRLNGMGPQFADGCVR
eukprot:1158258-Pelagomonas_calceolata.AAC.7